MLSFRSCFTVFALLLALPTTSKAARPNDFASETLIAQVQAHLKAGEVSEALSDLATARSADPNNPRLAYLHGVVLERKALGKQATEMDLLIGKALGIGEALAPSTAVFVELLTKPRASWEKQAATGTTVDSSAMLSWCTAKEERYPKSVYALADHVNLMRWGPLNLRSGEVAVPGNIEAIQRYAMVRLTTQAQYLDESARSALVEKLKTSGVAHAEVLLDLCFKNTRSKDYWRTLAANPSPDDWLFISSVACSLVTGMAAESIVPFHNRLVGKYPLLAREFVGWADARRVRYDKSALKTVEPSGPLKVRLIERGGAFVAGASFEIVRESSSPEEVLLTGTTAVDGSFVVPRETLSKPCVVKLGRFQAGRLTASDNILTQIEVHGLAGSIAPECELFDLDRNEAAQLSSFKGKVVYIDFWATWCGPCQKPMAELELLAKQKGEAWKDRVALLGVSIDADRMKLEAHLERRGWINVQHFWAGPDVKKVQGLFRVTGVPKAFLLDQNGRIVWTGRPSEIDVASMISKQLTTETPAPRK